MPSIVGRDTFDSQDDLLGSVHELGIVGVVRRHPRPSTGSSARKAEAGLSSGDRVEDDVEERLVEDGVVSEMEVLARKRSVVLDHTVSTNIARSQQRTSSTNGTARTWTGCRGRRSLAVLASCPIQSLQSRWRSQVRRCIRSAVRQSRLRRRKASSVNCRAAHCDGRTRERDSSSIARKDAMVRQPAHARFSSSLAITQREHSRVEPRAGRTSIGGRRCDPRVGRRARVEDASRVRKGRSSEGEGEESCCRCHRECWGRGKQCGVGNLTPQNRLEPLCRPALTVQGRCRLHTHGTELA